MKYTYLELVQTIGSSLGSDEINSISDSVESLQIADIVKTTYFDIINRSNLPSHYSLTTLEPSNDITKPILMTVPNTVEEIKWIKYNCVEETSDPVNMQVIAYMSLESYLNSMDMLDTTESNVSSFNITSGTDTFTIYYENDRPPSFYTTFDNNTILFDSYKSTVETTLQKSNSLCYSKLVIPFTLTDSFIPDLDDEQFPLLINEAKTLAWLELKQSPHPIADRNSKRNWTSIQKNKFATQHASDFDSFPDFSRRV